MSLAIKFGNGLMDFTSSNFLKNYSEDFIKDVNDFVKEKSNELNKHFNIKYNASGDFTIPGARQITQKEKDNFYKEIEPLSKESEKIISNFNKGNIKKLELLKDKIISNIKNMKGNETYKKYFIGIVDFIFSVANYIINKIIMTGKGNNDGGNNDFLKNDVSLQSILNDIGELKKEIGNINGQLSSVKWIFGIGAAVIVSVFGFLLNSINTNIENTGKILIERIDSIDKKLDFYQKKDGMNGYITKEDLREFKEDLKEIFKK